MITRVSDVSSPIIPRPGGQCITADLAASLVFGYFSTWLDDNEQLNAGGGYAYLTPPLHAYGKVNHRICVLGCLRCPVIHATKMGCVRHLAPRGANKSRWGSFGIVLWVRSRTRKPSLSSVNSKRVIESIVQTNLRHGRVYIWWVHKSIGLGRHLLGTKSIIYRMSSELLQITSQMMTFRRDRE
jgi:hypothetical protein